VTPPNSAPGNETDFDAESVPVQHAATVMVIADLPGPGGPLELHVLMLQRAARLAFAPAAWVFPGGRVDPEDHRGDLGQLCAGLTDHEASAILDVPRGGLAWWLAACRETFEEAGILLTADLISPKLAAVRDQIAGGRTTFSETLADHQIQVNAAGIHEVARFITPVGSPRRFDARFFVAAAPHGQVAQVDGGEIVASVWVTPHDALARRAAGQFEMISPTVLMIEWLGRHGSGADVLSATAERRPYSQVRVLDPEATYRAVLPGDDGYEGAAQDVESGWVRQ